MCKGVEEDVNPFRASEGSEGFVSCELCSTRASLYCLADDAYLCRNCDQSVHGANCLALRHVRCLLCKTCQNPTERYVLGISVEVTLPTILTWEEYQPCINSNAKRKGSTLTMKIPFLLL
ncbi:hypothetical protein M0R45_032954 [Rubus argutus]|uniref:B box-type domain-containing protein n=1 Tax=Rubus argutus TaxID=59490 RepID=A0AAW1WL10_RUBAR